MRKIAITLLAAAITVTAQAANPLSFDFMVTGSSLLRPTLVFHDGQNTYIQPPDNVSSSAIVVKDAKAERYGPYIMVRGIPKTFSLSSKAELVTITYTGIEKMQSGEAAQVPAPVIGDKPVIQTRVASASVQVAKPGVAPAPEEKSAKVVVAARSEERRVG